MQMLPIQVNFDAARYKHITNPKFLFDQLISDGLIWEEIVEGFVTSPIYRNKAYEVIMQDLITYRDVLDFEIYTQTVQRLFSNHTQWYHIKYIEDGGLKTDKAGHPMWDKTWYRIEIHNGPQIGRAHDSHAPCCRITIMAPGSRNLTSDIDTTIRVEGADNLAKEHLPESLKSLLDIDGILRLEIIRGFYQISETRHQMTSSLSRDSNVYSEGFMTDYPKFSEEHFNAVIGDKKVIQEIKQFYQAQKLKKHQYEIAASLYSLRCSLNQREWDEFKGITFQHIATLVSCNDNGNKARADLEIIFNYTNEWFLKAERELEARKLQKKNRPGLFILKKRQQNQTLWERDCEISALNDLYVEKLECVVRLNDSILNKRKQTLPRCIQHATESYHRLVNAQNAAKLLETSHSDNPVMREMIIAANSTASSAKQTYERNVAELKTVFEEIANLENEKQKAQIEAHFFANEAYVNRSAPYHVVMGMQSGKPVVLTRQTILGSALQQIGFKLLHAMKQERIGKSFGDIAYKNAKYGWRISDLVFDKNINVYSDQDVLRIGEFDGIITLLEKLSPRLRWDRVFTKEECFFLNLNVRIVKEVKLNDRIPENQKSQAAAQVMENGIRTFYSGGNASSFNIKSLLLSIASKLIAAVYREKYEVKRDFWGSYNISKEGTRLVEVKSSEVPHQYEGFYENFQLCPWKIFIEKAESIDILVTYYDTWVREHFGSLVNFFRNGGVMNIIQPTDDGVARQVSQLRFFDSKTDDLSRKIENTAPSIFEALKQAGNDKAYIKSYFSNFPHNYAALLIKMGGEKKCEYVILSLYEHCRGRYTDTFGKVNSPVMIFNLNKSNSIKTFWEREFSGVIKNSTPVKTYRIEGSPSSGKILGY